MIQKVNIQHTLKVLKSEIESNQMSMGIANNKRTKEDAELYLMLVYAYDKLNQLNKKLEKHGNSL